MAIQSLVPFTPASDLMTIPEIRGLLAQTGHAATKKDIEAWIKRDDLNVIRYLGKSHVSYSDILLAHRDAVLAGEV